VRDEEIDQQKDRSIIKKGQWRAEEDLISILITDNKEVSKYIFDQLSTSDFANEHLRNIFESLAHQWEELGHFDLRELERSLNTEADMNMISKLSLQVINNPLKYAAGCIYKMRKWHLDARYSEILRLMREESKSSKSKLHYTKELTEIRHRLSEVENEQKKYLKVDL
jgi:replicative DNA helicase